MLRSRPLAYGFLALSTLVTPTLAAFGYTTSGASIKIDTGAGLVFTGVYTISHE